MKDFQKNVSPYVDENASKSDGRTSVRYYMRRGLAHVIGFRYFCQGINCFLMTKEELIEWLTANGVDEEQIVLACEMLESIPEAFLWDDDALQKSIEDTEKFLEENYEKLRDEICYKSNFEDCPYTGVARKALLKLQVHKSNIDIKKLHTSLSKPAMIVGDLILEWRLVWIDDIPQEISLDTLMYVAALVVISNEYFKTGFKYPAPDDFWYGCTSYIKSMLEGCEKKDWEDKYDSFLEYLKDQLSMETDVEMSNLLEHELIPLHEIYNTLVTLEDNTQRLERQLNRNKDISLAIRDLLMTRHDRDFQFRYKYQWIGVYEVMGEQHLLPDNSVATFCRLCNDPKGTSYFLPEVDDELQGTNLYIAGDCYDKKSTYHQMISHGKEDRQREVIDKTKEIFEIFLTQRGVLNKEQ